MSANADIAGQIAAVREFNRFYTARIGLLRRRHLNGEFSLTEARVLYEIGSQPNRTAAALRSLLDLDAGYLSRILALLARRKLVRQTASKTDGREKLLTLTVAGRDRFEQLNEASAREIRELLRALTVEGRAELVVALGQARSILTANTPAFRIVRIEEELLPEAWDLLQEYYEAASVVVRDDQEELRQVIRTRGSGVWLAFGGNGPAGCVVLRGLDGRPYAGECKRLYVRPDSRGQGMAAALMDAVESYAVSEGLRWIYLDTYDDLKAAIKLYQSRGYSACPRYNDNPQATIFLRKRLAGRGNQRRPAVPGRL